MASWCLDFFVLDIVIDDYWLPVYAWVPYHAHHLMHLLYITKTYSHVFAQSLNFIAISDNWHPVFPTDLFKLSALDVELRCCFLEECMRVCVCERERVSECRLKRCSLTFVAKAMHDVIPFDIVVIYMDGICLVDSSRRFSFN